MSIRIENGIPIVPGLMPPLGEMPHENDAVIETLDLGALTGSQALDIPLASQEKSLWCWAACAKMVLYVVGLETIRQCRIAMAFLTQDCCAAPSHSEYCNVDCSPRDVAIIYDRLRVDADFKNQSISFSTVQVEISQNKLPVEVAIKWQGDNGGHLIVVVGWSLENGVRWVRVNDPLYGVGHIRFSDLSYYKGGRWICTWTGFRKQ